MRGRSSGHRRRLSTAAGSSGSGHGKHGLSVATTVDETFPITDAELDALEAFLTSQIITLLADEGPESRTLDSEAPQRPAQSKLHSVVAGQS